MTATDPPYGEVGRLFDYFDHTYIINLEHRLDRRREMLDNLGRLGVSLDARPISFFKAVRPENAGGFRTIGARGCFMSHLGVLKDAARSGYDKILIFEDDLDFTADFERRVPGVVQALEEKQWGAFYGGHEIPNLKPRGDLVLEEIPNEIGVICNHFIGFRAPHIAQLVEYLEAILSRPPGDPAGGPMDVDGAYSWYRGSHRDCLTFGCFPPLGVQRPSRTDISDTPWYDRLPLLNEPLRKLRKLKRRFSAR